MKAIYITGFMGAGKTTIGKTLANQINLPVIDTDQWIEAKKGKTIAEIFAEEGEQSFRTYEHDCLTALPTENVIITTGGGIVIQKKNRDWMQKWGTIVYLHCDAKEIFNRLKTDHTRPLLTKDKQENIERLFNERLPFYKEAHITIDTTGKSITEITTQIVEAIKKE